MIVRLSFKDKIILDCNSRYLSVEWRSAVVELRNYTFHLAFFCETFFGMLILISFLQRRPWKSSFSQMIGYNFFTSGFLYSCQQLAWSRQWGFLCVCAKAIFELYTGLSLLFFLKKIFFVMNLVFLPTLSTSTLSHQIFCYWIWIVESKPGWEIDR